MSTKAVDIPAAASTGEHPPGRRSPRRAALGVVLGLALTGTAAAAVGIVASDERRARPAVEQPSAPPVAPTPYPQPAEVFGGCLNDLECHGDASLRPPVPSPDGGPSTASLDG